MRWVNIAVLTAPFLVVGCTSCSGNRPGDAGVDADRSDSDILQHDADVEVHDADVDDGSQPDDADIPDGAMPVNLVEIHSDRPGLDCGRGCRQLSFGDEVFRARYDVGSQFVVYEGGDLRRDNFFLINYESGKESQFAWCSHSQGDPYNCALPAVHNGYLVYDTRPWESDFDWTLWLYRIGDRYRTPLVTRTMTERARALRDIDLYDRTVVWWDSTIYPAGLYAMGIDGGDVIGLTRNECGCYGPPLIWGRQVVYESWAHYTDVWMVNIDTHEERNLTDDEPLQFSAAFDGQWVVWCDSRNDPSPNPGFLIYNPDIYGMQLPDGEVEPLCDNPAAQTAPDVQNGLVAWEDFRNAENPNDGNQWATANVDIYLMDLATRREVQATDLPGPEVEPRIWGHRLFYVAKDLIGQWAIFMVDLDEAGLL